MSSLNRAELIERAVASVFAQTFTRWELVLIDDGSTDGSDRVMAQYAKNDPRVLMISRTNRGLAASRNQGIHISSGTYVGFLDSDDTLRPTHLQRHVRAMRSDPTLDFVMGSLAIVGPKSAQYVPDVRRPGRRIHLSRCQSAGSLFAKRKVLLEAGGFPLMEFGEDTALISRLKQNYQWKPLASRTYVYHCMETERMCDVFAREGVSGLRKLRRGEL